MFKKFLGITRNTVSDMLDTLKNVATGVRNVDDVLKNLPVSKSKRGYLLVGENTVGAVERMLRSADLDALARISKSNVRITSIDRSAFKSTLGVTPEIHLKSIDDAALATKRARPQLDAGSLDRLSNAAKSDLKKVESNLFRRFKEGAVIALTLGVVYVGVDWVVKATESRKGCWMLTTIDGKTTSCKLVTSSCIGNSSDACKIYERHYNATTEMIYISSLDDSNALKIGLASAAQVEPSKLRDMLPTLIDNKFEEMYRYITAYEYKHPEYKTCSPVHPGIEGGIVPPCRACSLTADPTSTLYISGVSTVDNVTYECVENPSYLDTITDTIASTGEDLWRGVSSGIGSILKKLGIVVVALLAVVALGALVFRLWSARRNRGRVYD